MFKYIEFPGSTRVGSCLIADDDFIELWSYDTKLDYSIYLCHLSSIINCYSSKNLNVAKNIVLYLNFEFPGLPPSWLIPRIRYYKENFPNFDKYLPDIEKYMALL